MRQLIDNLKQRLGALTFNQKVLLGAVACLRPRSLNA